MYFNKCLLFLLLLILPEGKRGTRLERWKHDEARLEKETRRLEKETPTVTVFLDSWLV